MISFFTRFVRLTATNQVPAWIGTYLTLTGQDMNCHFTLANTLASLNTIDMHQALIEQLILIDLSCPLQRPHMGINTLYF